MKLIERQRPAAAVAHAAIVAAAVRSLASPWPHQAAAGIGMAVLLSVLTPSATAAIPAVAEPRAQIETQIEINSVGFPIAAAKWAVVPEGPARGFAVVDQQGRTVLKGPLSASATWSLAERTVKLADLSALRQPGTYQLQVSGMGRSAPFVVGDSVYTPLTAAAIRAFYFNRAGIDITPALGGVYARAAGHPDTRVLIHASAVGPQRREGEATSSPKGWYDAGDYNKYIVNSGISTYTLLAAYEHFPSFYRDLKVGVPETGNGLPDLLNEALWNLDWMLTMQDPADGGVYHKLTNLKFDGMVMPAAATTDRYVVQKTTAATLDFAAVMAAASRVLAPLDAQSPGRSARMRSAAIAAWDWAQQHRNVLYQQPADVVTGAYDDTRLDDEFAWAAAELLVTTGEQRFLDAMRLGQVPINVPSWSDVQGLAWVTLAQHQNRLPAADRVIVQQRIRTLAVTLVQRWKQSAWRVPMQAEDYRWGSNSEVLNQALMLIQAARLIDATPTSPADAAARQLRRDALAAAQANLDYVLGRNPLGRSQVTGFGLRPPMHPHHRPSEADGITDPIPGFLVGGANPGQQDKAECPVPYPSSLTALSWLDHLCSYASNEVAINWNAPLVYVAGALDVLGRADAVPSRKPPLDTRGRPVNQSSPHPDTQKGRP
ncbi:glycoside hydrolase family 9 protein [Roseateles sp. SL47]|uniref:glycoside hydrolase family 9 protein n=1 Tax=Roseateles sp. SL47 TaxID=2995138 RepID=UPI0022700C7D|nr:glycoside hydrolase family 9 protein [Roseateles sp. SL47]WAC71456.1 glycoside hydrolase family 9 protein [Roseateles sp. SL47]